MDSLQITLSVPVTHQDRLIAELSAWPVNGFRQFDETIVLYLDAEHDSDTFREALGRVLAALDLPGTYREESIPNRNWNRIWEASVRAVRVSPFVIRPTWDCDARKGAGEIELIVDPKMSFGTGHHATTRLMLRHLAEIGTGESEQTTMHRVLDAGTGTGILAVAAAKLGASMVLAYDTDTWCQLNASETVRLNEVATVVSVRLGELNVVDEREFDLIMANINLNVLLACLEGMAARLSDSGQLVLSGLLVSDRQEMVDACRRHGLLPTREIEEVEWWSGAFSFDRSVRRSGS